MNIDAALIPNPPTPALTLSLVHPGEVFHFADATFEAALDDKSFYLATDLKPVNLYTGKALDVPTDTKVITVHAKAVVSKI